MCNMWEIFGARGEVRVEYYIVQKLSSHVIGPFYFYPDAEKYLADNYKGIDCLIAPRIVL